MSWKLPKFDKRTLLFFGAIFCLLLSITTLLTTSNLSRPTIRADGEGYYLYLPALFIHHDLSMKWSQPLWTQPLQIVDNPSLDNEWNGLYAYKTGVYLDKYPIGLAVLWSPFFLVAHMLSLLTGHPATGFTIWYEAAIGVAAAFYASLGCVMMYKLLRRYFSAKVSYFTVLTLLLGTNMLSYATYDASFTHVYSLFLIAAVVFDNPKVV